ncbi:hypothetical protein CRT60_11810 [Azospirillum palustre]|uniref:HD Cas3-type domain-containing protein n=1 Tax=Azospirillum palustre TaxID=2044885 RepID=A0A2B8BHX9_9PROT|nr:type I-U CRISPR-associated helicase/endonuclease Cas3 [Azospirillum palustre]PGH57158.1 hypothetical protein CRT60_11810 [Azospirillum palustre]
MTSLTADHFTAFFTEIHGHPPFPWQQRLATQVAADGEWPDQLALPTGFGKTAAIDIAVFHLALESDRLSQRRAPMRIAFVVDRRLVVDDAFERADKIRKALIEPKGPITTLVAERLRRLTDEPDAPPLVVQRLRGGIPREDGWARSPAQPTILCSTVDQVGSRLLFRGYGVSDAAKPIHAGLIGADCLILLDEAHLAEPFRQTLRRIAQHKGGGPEAASAPWRVALLSATPRPEEGATLFKPDSADADNPILAARQTAAKPVRLIAPPKGKADAAAEEEDGAKADAAAERQRVGALAEAVTAAIADLRAQGIDRPAVAVVVNRIVRARQLFERLKAEPGVDAEPILMIGPTRAPDREKAVEELAPLRTRLWTEGETRPLERTTIVVATQCLEAGADLDFDGLISEAAPLDALRQRFGRLNRAGRPFAAHGAVVAGKPELSTRHDDPVYGRSIKAAWDWLCERAAVGGTVDFGPAAFDALVKEAPPVESPSPYSPHADAPVLMPAHLDLLSQTAPVPACDPEVALYLHGPRRQPDAVSVIWRADVEPDRPDADLRRLLLLVPPRSGEAVELPVWTVRRWLTNRVWETAALADLPATEPDESASHRSKAPAKRVFRWSGDDERSGWIEPAALRPGDTIVVPAGHGGLDLFGWNPEAAGPVRDVAADVAEPFAGRRFNVRVAPGLLLPHLEGLLDKEERRQLEADVAARLRQALADTGSVTDWVRVRETLLALGLPDELEKALNRLDHAKGRHRRVEMHRDLYGDQGEQPRGIVFVAPLGLRDATAEEDAAAGGSTDDDIAGSLTGYAQPLLEHSGEVEAMTTRFAHAAGLPQERVADLAIAGYLHDLGKIEPRFQRWLAGDPLADPDRVLAKSGRKLPRDARERAGLPRHWRHEALSVRLARETPRLEEAKDPQLVLWLVGTHHGHGRPLFPHSDGKDAEERANLPAVLGNPTELAPGCGPQSLGFDLDGLDWPGLFERLKATYGLWELARMEAILRLADQRASAAAAKRRGGEAGKTADKTEGDAA